MVTGDGIKVAYNMEKETIHIDPFEELLKVIEIVHGKPVADVWRRVIYMWKVKHK